MAFAKIVQRITRDMSEPYRTETAKAISFWIKRGRELLNDTRATGSELRAASIGVRTADPNLSHKLAKRAVVEIGKFNQKNKL